MKSIKLRSAIAGAILLISIIYLIPSVVPNLPGFWKTLHLPQKKVRLGLDLKGGMYLALGVDVNKALENRLSSLAEDLRNRMEDAGFPIYNMNIEGLKVSFSVTSGKAEDKLNSILSSDFPDLMVAKTEREGRKIHYTLTFTKKAITYIKDHIVEQAVETIRNRVDQFGVTEPEVFSAEGEKIIVQLPGIKDPERAKRIISKTAHLEFKLVDDSQERLSRALSGNIPPGEEVLYEISVDRERGIRRKIPILLYKRTLLTGEYIKNAVVRIDPQYGEPYVAIDFDSRGAKIFEDITGKYVGKRLAIILDNVVYSAPVIQEKIVGGRARITGNFSMDEAKDLAVVLRAGSLPAPVKLLEERTVGPSLGRDLVKWGIFSLILGFVLVVAFMVFYYNLSGAIADLALFMNVVIIFAVLSAFKATLTLPGIAGVVLTIGMAVDANVLIFERIREELRKGASIYASIDAGYSRAFITILDANLTTLITAVILYQFGTGPIKGFAVTLSIGIVASMFTAIFVTRIIFDYLIFKKRVSTLRI